KRPRATRHFDAGPFQMRGERIERRGMGHFPAVERGALVFIGVNDDALLAIVHAQRQRAAALLDKLHAEEARAIGRPVLEIAGADTDITERIEIHGLSFGSAPTRLP